ncbi:MAG: anthranilate phosphoribosyltransferase [Rhodothermia bacterium]|nr:anthranilate phosphoribosyltransferase [Rhodothermia bacterium]
MKEALSIVASGQKLSRSQAGDAMRVVMSGNAGPEEIAGFLIGVTARGPSVDELSGFTEVLREFAVRVAVDDENAIDLCGTGGDGAGLFNVSTAAAFVCAGAGCTVAKHGNRSISSKSGSADVLEALGVEAALPARGVEHCIREAGIGFMFAPLFHPAMKNVMPIRRALGVRTFFNMLGPLCNPAGVRRQLVGAFSVVAAEKIAGVLAQLGAEYAIVVHSEDGLDEVSVSAPTTKFVCRRQTAGEAERSTFDPASLGVRPFPIDELQGSGPEHNARMTLDVLSGSTGGPREIVAVNAAHGIVAAGLAETVAEALVIAYESIDSGAATARLDALRKASTEAKQLA